MKNEEEYEYEGWEDQLAGQIRKEAEEILIRARRIGKIAHDWAERLGGYGNKTIMRIANHPDVDRADDSVRNYLNLYRLEAKYGEEIRAIAPNLYASHWYKLARFLNNRCKVDNSERKALILDAAWRAHKNNWTKTRLNEYVSLEIKKTQAQQIGQEHDESGSILDSLNDSPPHSGEGSLSENDAKFAVQALIDSDDLKAGAKRIADIASRIEGEDIHVSGGAYLEPLEQLLVACSKLGHELVRRGSGEEAARKFTHSLQTALVELANLSDGTEAHRLPVVQAGPKSNISERFGISSFEILTRDEEAVRAWLDPEFPFPDPGVLTEDPDQCSFRISETQTHKA